jgi:hypothetical protein
VRERNSRGALAVAMAVALGLLLPAAFGRADPGHVLFNGLGVLVLFLAFLMRHGRRLLSAVAILAILGVHALAGSLLTAYGGHSPFAEAIATRKLLGNLDTRANAQAWHAAAGASGRLRYGKLPPFSYDLSLLLRFDGVGTPFYPGEQIDRFLKLSGRHVPEYYSGLNMQVYTRSELQRKKRDVDRMDVILVPKDRWSAPVFVNESNAELLAPLLLFPARLIPAPRHVPLFPGLELVRHIERQFTLVGEFRSFQVWRRQLPAAATVGGAARPSGGAPPAGERAPG